MESPSFILCPVSTTVITEVKGSTTELLTSQLALILTHVTSISQSPADEYTWFNYTYLTNAPTDPPASFYQVSEPESSHSTHQKTSTNARITATEVSSQPHKSNNVLNTGAIAGIAVACAILGAIVSATIACCLLRRRRKHHGPSEACSSDCSGREKRLPSIPITDKTHLHHFLLDEKPDKDTGVELKSLGHLIRQHVENNYHLNPVQCDVDVLSQSLVQLGLDRNTHIAVDNLASLALDPTTRYNALRHVIARVTFNSITLEENPPVSLLPPPVAGFNLLVPPTEDMRGNPEALQVALTRWRQLSAFLLHPHRSDRSPLTPSEEVGTQQAQELAVSMNAFLEPFITGDREDRYEQENHLREVIVECATFGYVLFSQPSEFRFLFNSDEGQGKIVVCPGLEKVSDEDGYRYSSPAQPIVMPMIETISQT